MLGAHDPGWYRAAGYNMAYVDPYAALRGNTTTATDPEECERPLSIVAVKIRLCFAETPAHGL